jgi:hypothetical protein
MSQHYASFLSDRLLRIFQRSGSDGEFLKPFSKFPKMIQEQLLEQAKIQDDEGPIIACFFRHDDWVVLTTERLYGRIYGFGDRAKPNKASKRPLTQASLRCTRWLNPSSLQRIPTPLNRC